MATKRMGEAYWGEELHVTLVHRRAGNSLCVAAADPVHSRGELRRTDHRCGRRERRDSAIRLPCQPGPLAYRRLRPAGHPGNSHVDFPEGLGTVEEQVAWSLRHLRDRVSELLARSEQEEASRKVESYLVETGLINIRNHIEKNAYLRKRAIEEKVIMG